MGRVEEKVAIVNVAATGIGEKIAEFLVCEAPRLSFQILMRRRAVPSPLLWAATPFS